MKRLLFFALFMVIHFLVFSQTTGSFTDPRDGKTYKTIKIGYQWIMAENLAYKPADGKYWAYGNDEGNVDKYGYLYNFKTANKLAPHGWHLPSIEEWEKFYKFLGGNNGEVKNAISEGQYIGFNLCKGGIRNIFGFGDLGKIDVFWSSTPTWDFYIFSEVLPMRNMDSYKCKAPDNCGCSVRFIKDQTDEEKELETWEGTRNLNTITDLEIYLDKYPESIHADSAALLLKLARIYEKGRLDKIKSAPDDINKLEAGMTFEQVDKILEVLKYDDKRDFIKGLAYTDGTLTSGTLVTKVSVEFTTFSNILLKFEDYKLTNWSLLK